MLALGRLVQRELVLDGVGDLLQGDRLPVAPLLQFERHQGFVLVQMNFLALAGADRGVDVGDDLDVHVFRDHVAPDAPDQHPVLAVESLGNDVRGGMAAEGVAPGLTGAIANQDAPGRGPRIAKRANRAGGLFDRQIERQPLPSSSPPRRNRAAGRCQRPAKSSASLVRFWARSFSITSRDTPTPA